MVILGTVVRPISCRSDCELRLTGDPVQFSRHRRNREEIKCLLSDARPQIFRTEEPTDVDVDRGEEGSQTIDVGIEIVCPLGTSLRSLQKLKNKGSRL